MSCADCGYDGDMERVSVDGVEQTEQIAYCPSCGEVQYVSI